MKNLFLPLALSLSLVTGTGATTAAKVPESSQVSTADSMKVAKNFISLSIYKDDWADCQLVLKHKLYDLDDTVLGYYFVVSKKGEDIGYLIVSATKERTPLLQYGESTLDHLFDKQIGQGNKIYYLGGLYYEYAQDKNDLKKKMTKEPKSVPKSYTASTEWANLLSAKSPSVSANATTYKLLSVTRYYQRMNGVTNPSSACGPTTAAMIVNYYSSNGYSVYDSSDYGGVANLINHLYDDMDTNWYGTSISEWKYGMTEHMNEEYGTWGGEGGYYADFDGTYTNGKSSYTWAITDGDPVALRFDRFSSGYAEYHFVAGIGFDNSSSSMKFAVKDPDNGSSNTGTHWLDWNTNDQDMEMAWVSYY